MGRRNNKSKKQQYKKVNVIIPSSIIKENVIEEKIIEEKIIINVNKIEIIDDYMNKLPAIVDKVIDVPAVDVGYGNSCVIF